MKTLLVILMMIPLLSWGQMSSEYLDYDIDLKLEHVSVVKKQKTSNNHDVYIHPGVGCMLGGGMFMLLAMTTPNEGHFVNGKYEQKPFFTQPAHALAFVTGAVIFSAGVVVTIGG
jgi:hypothetical protein